MQVVTPEGDLKAGEIVVVQMFDNGKTLVQRADMSFVRVQDVTHLAPPTTTKTTAGPRLNKAKYDLARNPSAFADIAEGLPRVNGGYVTKGENGENAVLGRVYAKQGFHHKPHVISAAEYETYVQAGEAQLWRGVTAGPKGKQQYADEFVNGAEHYPGWGIFGNGTYTSVGPMGGSTAQSYTQGTGTVLRMTLRKNARVTTEEALQKEFDRHRDTLPPHLRDLGVYAAARGYDGYYAATNAYFILLNRGAVRVVR